MSDQKFNVAMIGLGFGAEFIPIYQAHANANVAAICRRDETKLNQVRRYVWHRKTIYEIRGCSGRSGYRLCTHQ